MYGSTWYVSVIQSCMPISLSLRKFLMRRDCDLNVAVSPAASSPSSKCFWNEWAIQPKGKIAPIAHTLP